MAERIEQNVADQVLRDDIVQLNGSHSWFKADENEDLAVLQQRLNEQDILLTAPLIGEENLSASAVENKSGFGTSGFTRVNETRENESRSPPFY